MASSQDQIQMVNEEEDFLRVMLLPGAFILPLVLKAAIELDLFEIMTKCSPGARLSASQIATHLPTQNPDAPLMLDRMLRFLASQNFLTCTVITGEDGNDDHKRLYSLLPVCKCFVRNQDGVSSAPLLLSAIDRVMVESWYLLSSAILEGGIAFNKAHGMRAFEYAAKDERFNEVFNEAMYSHTSIVMRKVVDKYTGFEGVKEIVDVGGGLGASLSCVVSKYPHVKGINFDLPHVIEHAPASPGVEHVAGDMFESVPKGEVIFLKWILHDWSDDHCVKILKNCWNALPEYGKVIVVEQVLPEYPEIDDPLSQLVIQFDVCMMTLNPGGKERSEKEFEALARQAGFATSKLICPAYNYWIIEFYKKI